MDKEDAIFNILAKPSDRMIILDKDKSKQFLEDRKKNTIPPEFLEQCLRYRRMMNKKEDSE